MDNLSKTVLNSKFVKLLFIIPLVLSISFALIMVNWVYRGAQEETDLMFDAMINQARTAAERINFYKETGGGGCIKDKHIEALVLEFENWSSVDSTIAILFDSDLKRLTKNERMTPFHLNRDNYPQFWERVAVEQEGIIQVPFSARQDMKVFFKWVPDEVEPDQQVLMVVGVTPDINDEWTYSALCQIGFQVLMSLIVQYILISIIVWGRKRAIRMRQKIEELGGSWND